MLATSNSALGHTRASVEHTFAAVERTFVAAECTSAVVAHMPVVLAATNLVVDTTMDFSVQLVGDQNHTNMVLAIPDSRVTENGTEEQWFTFQCTPVKYTSAYRYSYIVNVDPQTHKRSQDVPT